MKTEIKELGAQFTAGACSKLATYFAIGIVFLMAVSTVANFFQWGVDNSDVSSWDRSGLKIYTDNLTGVQYVSDGNSLCVRVDAKGDPVLSR